MHFVKPCIMMHHRLPHLCEQISLSLHFPMAMVRTFRRFRNKRLHIGYRQRGREAPLLYNSAEFSAEERKMMPCATRFYITVSAAFRGFLSLNVQPYCALFVLPAAAHPMNMKHDEQLASETAQHVTPMCVCTYILSNYCHVSQWCCLLGYGYRSAISLYFTRSRSTHCRIAGQCRSCLSMRSHSKV